MEVLGPEVPDAEAEASLANSCVYCCKCSSCNGRLRRCIGRAKLTELWQAHQGEGYTEGQPDSREVCKAKQDALHVYQAEDCVSGQGKTPAWYHQKCRPSSSSKAIPTGLDQRKRLFYPKACSDPRYLACDGCLMAVFQSADLDCKTEEELLKDQTRKDEKNKHRKVLRSSKRVVEHGQNVAGLVVMHLTVDSKKKKSFQLSGDQHFLQWTHDRHPNVTSKLLEAAKLMQTAFKAYVAALELKSLEQPADDLQEEEQPVVALMQQSSNPGGSDDSRVGGDTQAGDSSLLSTEQPELQSSIPAIAGFGHSMSSELPTTQEAVAQALRDKRSFSKAALLTILHTVFQVTCQPQFTRADLLRMVETRLSSSTQGHAAPLASAGAATGPRAPHLASHTPAPVASTPGFRKEATGIVLLDTAGEEVYTLVQDLQEPQDNVLRSKMIGALKDWLKSRLKGGETVPSYWKTVVRSVLVVLAKEDSTVTSFFTSIPDTVLSTADMLPYQQALASAARAAQPVVPAARAAQPVVPAARAAQPVVPAARAAQPVVPAGVELAALMQLQLLAGGPGPGVASRAPLNGIGAPAASGLTALQQLLTGTLLGNSALAAAGQLHTSAPQGPPQLAALLAAPTLAAAPAGGVPPAPAAAGQQYSDEAVHCLITEYRTTAHLPDVMCQDGGCSLMPISPHKKPRLIE